jgi:OOP family OmpA-OmpF porin
MKKHMRIALILAAAAFSLPLSASADAYMIAGIGQASTNAATLTQNSSVAAELGWGSKKNMNFAIEGGVAFLGSRVSMNGAKDTLDAIYFDTVGILPVEQFVDVEMPLEFTARLGIAYTQARGSVVGASANAARVGATYGLGAQYALDENMAVRLQWSRYKFGDNLNYPSKWEDVLTIGVNYGF